MAATGDDAAAMDSISRAPASHPAAPNPAAAPSSRTELPEAAAEGAVVFPKKPNASGE